MRPVNPKRSKSLSFMIGLIYGYRTADIDMKILPLEEFEAFEEDGYNVYYINREADEVSKNIPLGKVTHIVAIKEDVESKKVRIRIFKPSNRGL